MPTLDAISAALRRRQPELMPDPEKKHAAVAVVLRDGERGPEVLFIERARQEGDPWSGHMAFPGGRVEAEDSDARTAAERETREEVGLELAGAQLLGRLDDLPGRGGPQSKGLVISAHVYHFPDHGPLDINHEVEMAFWFPLRDLLDPARHVEHRITELPMPFPGILVGEPDRHVVWGLTYRFLEVFLGIAGRPLPTRWSWDRDKLVGDAEDALRRGLDEADWS